MRPKFSYILPPIYGLLLFIFYVLLYNPLKTSHDFSTAALVFFAGLGWSAAIKLTQQTNQYIFWLYISISILCPILVLVLFDWFTTTILKVMVGVIVIGIIGIRLFILYLQKHAQKI